jgi:acyl carrier protein
MKTRNEIKEIIIDAIVSTKPGMLNIEDVNESDYLKDSLGLDSLDTVELIMHLEKEFNIGITEEDFEGVETVGQLIELVENILKS